VILSLVVFIVYRNARVNRIPDDKITIDDIRIRMMGEELVGLKALDGFLAPAQSAKLVESHERAISQLSENAHTPADRLHVAIIAGEILGKEQALTRLDVLTHAQPDPELEADIAALRQIYFDNATALDSSSQNRLIRRHDYFARVALAYGVASSMEPRKSIEAGGRRATLMLGVVALIVLVMLLGGVGLFITAIVLWVKGRMRRMYVRDPDASTAYLEGFAIYFVLFFLGLGLLRRYIGWKNLQWEWLALLIIPVVMFWFATRGSSSVEQRTALGWHTGKGIFREIGAGIAGYLVGIVVMIPGLIITYFLIKHTGLSPDNSPIFRMLEGNRWHVLGVYALVSVYAPVMEETMFRGALFHHLRRRWGWAISAPIVAFIFAVIHPQGWVAVPALGSIAMVLAGLREWRGSLIAPMVAHACNNFIVVTIALLVFR